MCEVMVVVELGDDVYGEDFMVNCLEVELVVCLGFVVVFFVLIGIMSNLFGLMVYCECGDEYIVGQQVYIYKYEGGGVVVLGLIQLQLIDGEVDGLFDLDKVVVVIKVDDFYFVRICLLVLENIMQGKVLLFDYLVVVCVFICVCGLVLYLDGVCLYNVVVKLGVDVSEII